MIRNNFLNEILEFEKMNASELANILSVNKSTVARWLNGDIENMKIDKIYLLAKKLDINPNWILGNSEIYNLSSFNKIRSESFLETPVAIAGSGSCGLGSFNEDSIIEWFNTPVEWLNNKNPDDFFWAYASGNSMKDIGIIDNALLLFKKQVTLTNEEIGVFHLNGEEYIKKFKKTKDVVMLISANSNYEPIIVNKNDDFRIIAKLVKEVINFA